MASRNLPRLHLYTLLRLQRQAPTTLEGTQNSPSADITMLALKHQL